MSAGYQPAFRVRSWHTEGQKIGRPSEISIMKATLSARPGRWANIGARRCSRERLRHDVWRVSTKLGKDFEVRTKQVGDNVSHWQVQARKKA